MSEGGAQMAMQNRCTAHAYLVHIAGAAWLAVLAAVSGAPALAAGLVTKWEAALEGCVSLVETGDPNVLAVSDWTQDQIDGEVTFRHRSGVAITARLPLFRGEKVSTSCRLSYGSKIAGNDRRGQVLREALRVFAEGRLAFREEDQILPPDVYRGCAWDRKQFRLSSMTQTTYASFGIQLSPRAAECAALTS